MACCSAARAGVGTNPSRPIRRAIRHALTARSPSASRPPPLAAPQPTRGPAGRSIAIPPRRATPTTSRRVQSRHGRAPFSRVHAAVDHHHRQPPGGDRRLRLLPGGGPRRLGPAAGPLDGRRHLDHRLRPDRRGRDPAQPPLDPATQPRRGAGHAAVRRGGSGAPSGAHVSLLPRRAQLPRLDDGRPHLGRSLAHPGRRVQSVSVAAPGLRQHRDRGRHDRRLHLLRERASVAAAPARVLPRRAS